MGVGDAMFPRYVCFSGVIQVSSLDSLLSSCQGSRASAQCTPDDRVALSESLSESESLSLMNWLLQYQ